MQLAARHLLTQKTRSTRVSARRATRAETTSTRLAKRAGETQDRALYTCHCGFAWTADVSTSVGCPNCGSQQAW